MIEWEQGAPPEAKIGERRDTRSLQLELCRRIGLDAVAAALGVAAEPRRPGRRIPATVVRKGRAA